MPDFIPVVDAPTPDAAFHRGWSLLARASALLALAVMFGGIAYSEEPGFFVYGILFALPYLFFILWPNGRRWQSWGYALAWVIGVFALAGVALSGIGLARAGHIHLDVIAVVVSFVTLLLAQIAQMVCVRRAGPGKIAFGRPLFRTILYYICLLLVIAATLPNWYVPPRMRLEGKAVRSLHAYSEILASYAKGAKDAAYPSSLAAANMPALDPSLVCVAPCEKNGYRFDYHPVISNEHVVAYTVSARPLEYEDTGPRSFLLTSEGKIYWTKDNREARTTDETL